MSFSIPWISTEHTFDIIFIYDGRYSILLTKFEFIISVFEASKDVFLHSLSPCSSGGHCKQHDCNDRK